MQGCFNLAGFAMRLSHRKRNPAKTPIYNQSAQSIDRKRKWGKGKKYGEREREREGEGEEGGGATRDAAKSAWTQKQFWLQILPDSPADSKRSHKRSRKNVPSLMEIKEPVFPSNDNGADLQKVCSDGQ